MRNLLAFLVLSAPAFFAQTPAPATPAAPPAPVVSPEVLPDHRVIFRLRAPMANEVIITGDFWVQEGRREKLAKGDGGVWSLTTEPLPPDEYSYWFIVDGVPIPDPANGHIKPGMRTQQNTFAIPGSDEAILEPGAVPHGEVRIVNYQSTLLARPRRMYIYFPPGYEQGKTRYPVTYLLHGGGDDDWGWVSVGRVNFILDNLIAQGKAKPMIVVMPSLWALDPPIPAARLQENVALFQKSLVNEIIPYVEQHYSALQGPANRALGGLGVLRTMLPDLLWPTLDKFNYVGFVSGGTDPDQFEALQKQYPGALDNPANVKRVKFFLGDGSNDNSIGSSRGFATQLKQRGYTVTTFETGGTHGWPSFRRCFEEWAQQAFR